MIIQASILNPPVREPDWHRRWEGDDKGLICAWLQGIDKAIQDPTLAGKAKNNELPVTAFRGGILKPLKDPDKTIKTGSLHYIAYWQGLRGEDLSIDMDEEPTKTCAATRTKFVYTADISKLLAQTDTEEDTE